MVEQQRGENININEMIDDAEKRFRKGISFLNEWGAQARDMIERQPGAVIAGVAILGFVTGLLLRRAVSRSEER